MIDMITGQGSLSSPGLYWFFAKKDMDVVKRQMVSRKFQQKIVASVVCRCCWGAPQVLYCRPFYKKTPFPTSFWLTCPYLVAKCGELESQHGVSSVEEYLQKNVSLHRWISYHIQHINVRLALLSSSEKRYFQKRRPELWRAITQGGVGGIQNKNSFTVKCLHLHVASWLALGTHPAEEWFRQHIEMTDCKTPNDYSCIARGGVLDVEGTF
ncbi:MAG: DUF501 domain-containing protein [Aminobacterium sp.]|nr:DUF501 domain-containing protein [Aminobacterium sp.]